MIIEAFEFHFNLIFVFKDSQKTYHIDTIIKINHQFVSVGTNCF